MRRLRAAVAAIGFGLPLSGVLAAASASEAAPTAASTAGIELSRPWARATVTDTGVAFLSIHNAGPADRLEGVSTPVAARAGLHEMSMSNGMMEMRALPSLSIPAGATVVLSPDDRHIMLEGLNRRLRRGDNFPLKLRFQHAGVLELQVPVAGPGAEGPDGAKH
ncbi:copper chaperone PCu(A)C [Rhizosaccharibacter radicis]|uniref:Copper chaperone PCu(A)C n=1 Tax=Rhizosaccharibacter radicis TaxID=2782605 RepID=A0ABT1W446_9PROT|nr:copper chaperone PCu(A)C [Acetobacteraceae bacterium KSS12]